MTVPELRFQEPNFHDDDLAAKGDEIRDQVPVDTDPIGPRPDPRELA